MIWFGGRHHFTRAEQVDGPHSWFCMELSMRSDSSAELRISFCRGVWRKRGWIRFRRRYLKTIWIWLRSRCKTRKAPAPIGYLDRYLVSLQMNDFQEGRWQSWWTNIDGNLELAWRSRFKCMLVWDTKTTRRVTIWVEFRRIPANLWCLLWFRAMVSIRPQSLGLTLLDCMGWSDYGCGFRNEEFLSAISESREWKCGEKVEFEGSALKGGFRWPQPAIWNRGQAKSHDLNIGWNQSPFFEF
jgi:hypothetical protein